MRITKNKKIIIACLTLAVIAVIIISSVLLGLFYCKNYAKLEQYKVGNESNVKVGIISDSQLPANGNMDSKWVKTLRSSMQVLKDRNIEVLIFAGDFTDLATTKAWQSFKNVYDDVFGNNKPIASFVMGNHDYWLDWNDGFQVGTPQVLKRRFTKYTGEYPYSHKVVNGYHFINWSTGNGNSNKSYKAQSKWVKKQLDIAVADDPNKPIFVTTHFNPQDTVYGSDSWGNTDITELLKNYPQVVSFSGHSHYALEDERSINQSDFTAINTQSLDYMELEDDKFNGSIPVDAYGNQAYAYPMAMIMDITDKIEIQRVSINIETAEGVNVKDKWIINAPYGVKSNFIYTTEKRRATNSKPLFTEQAINDSVIIQLEKDNNNNNIKTISFTQAKDDEFVHSYKLIFKDKNNNIVPLTETKYDGSAKVVKANAYVNYDSNTSVPYVYEILYFSDFTLGIKNMKSSAKLRLPYNIPQNVSKIEIYAIDSWGMLSENYISANYI